MLLSPFVPPSPSSLLPCPWVFYVCVSIGEGNGTPLQYSCLENPRDGGAWWAVVSGVTQSRTRLKWLGSSRSSIAAMQIGASVSRFHLFYSYLTFDEVAQSCPTLYNPMDCSLPGSSVHRIFQERILEWVAISFSRKSSWPRDRTHVPRIVGRCFTIWATREVYLFYSS